MVFMDEERYRLFHPRSEEARNREPIDAGFYHQLRYGGAQACKDRNSDFDIWCDFRKVSERTYTKDDIFREGIFREDISFEVGEKTRYVRVVAYGAGDCPFTHVRPGQEARIYFDEIIVE